MYKSKPINKMNSKDIQAFYEAYAAVYDEELRDELEEMSDEFAGIEELSDEEIDAIVEETIDEMIEEGYEFDEVEEIFEGVILEMNPYAPAGSKAARQYAKATTASKRGAERSAARAATVAKVKGAVKSALGKAKEAARRVVDEPARKYAEKRGVVRSKSGKTALGSGTGIGSVAYKQKTSQGRREVRSAVAKDIKGRVRKKIAQAQVDAYSAARGARQAASDVAGRTRQSAEYTAARTRRGVRSAIRGAAERVASGATKLASRMATEEVDIYDIVLEHLCVEGYADTIEAAEAIMANMSEDWRNSIVEEMLDEELTGTRLSRAARMDGEYARAKKDRTILHKVMGHGNEDQTSFGKGNKATRRQGYSVRDTSDDSYQDERRSSHNKNRGVKNKKSGNYN